MSRAKGQDLCTHRIASGARASHLRYSIRWIMGVLLAFRPERLPLASPSSPEQSVPPSLGHLGSSGSVWSEWHPLRPSPSPAKGCPCLEEFSAGAQAERWVSLTMHPRDYDESLFLPSFSPCRSAPPSQSSLTASCRFSTGLALGSSHHS